MIDINELQELIDDIRTTIKECTRVKVSEPSEGEERELMKNMSNDNKQQNFNEKLKAIKFQQALKKVFKVIERAQAEKGMSVDDSINFYLTIALQLIAAIHSQAEFKNIFLDHVISKINLLRDVKNDY
jgi:hypothetical protein